MKKLVRISKGLDTFFKVMQVIVLIGALGAALIARDGKKLV